jgi:hypothetical protein
LRGNDVAAYAENAVVKPGFADYSGAAPILLPVSILHFWHGFYLPADPTDESADLELPDGRFKIWGAESVSVRFTTRKMN